MAKGNSADALEELCHQPRRPAPKFPIPHAEDPLQRAMRVLLDPAGEPATLRDVVAAVLHAGFLAGRKHWPDGPDHDPDFHARAAWREVDHYFSARADDAKGRR